MESNKEVRVLGTGPTRLSSYKRTKICNYCSNAVDDKCLAGVPYYAVSLGCDYFSEPVVKRKNRLRKKYLNLKKVLVETI